MIRYINEIIESVLLVINEEGLSRMCGGSGDQSTNAATHNHGHSIASGGGHDNQSASAEWAQMLEAATQRRTEVLMPENLENLWTKGRDYKRRENRSTKVGFHDHSLKNPATDSSEGKSSLHPIHTVGSDPQLNVGSPNRSESSLNHDKELSLEADHHIDEAKDIKDLTSNNYKKTLMRSNSTSGLAIQPNIGGSTMSEFHIPDMVVRREGQSAPKPRCRVCTFDRRSYGL